MLLLCQFSCYQSIMFCGSNDANFFNPICHAEQPKNKPGLIFYISFLYIFFTFLFYIYFLYIFFTFLVYVSFLYILIIFLFYISFFLSTTHFNPFNFVMLFRARSVSVFYTPFFFLSNVMYILHTNNIHRKN